MENIQNININPLQKYINFDTLYISMKKCQKNVIWKGSVAHFVLNCCSELTKLEEEVLNGTIEFSAPYTFHITSPKARDIVSVKFRDRVLERTLNYLIIYPIMTKSFIYDNCACQTGKGTDFARNRLTSFMRRAFINNNNSIDNLYILQMDIKGYYPNMHHDKVEEMFKNNLPPEVFELVLKILKAHYPGDIGYNPGSQLIQIAGISLLNPLDHYIKEQLNCKYYLRYMDDSIIIGYKEDLEQFLPKIVAVLNELGFRLNEKKSKIFPIKNGVKFLGFKFMITNTGKVLKLVCRENVKRERSHLCGLVRQYKKDKINLVQLSEIYNCWVNHISKGNSFYVLQKMDMYYHSLLRGKNNEN